MEEWAFITGRRYHSESVTSHRSDRGGLLIAACRSGSALASRVTHCYQMLTAQEDGEEAAGPVAHEFELDTSFSDSESSVRIESHVSGADVFLFQCLYDPLSSRPVDQNYLALLIAVRAFREHGARHITVLAPYLAYSRQDKPTRFTREPTTARLMADLTASSGADRLVTWHPHSDQLRGFYGPLTVHMLDPLDLFVEIFDEYRGRDDCIVVAPDAGALKLATYFSRRLSIQTAIAAKFRPRPEEVQYSEVIGQFSGKRVALILDDILSSGGTVQSLVRTLVRDKGIREVHLGISHNLCRDIALARIREMHDQYNLRSLVVTDSIPQSAHFTALPNFSVRSLSDTFCRLINRIHYNHSVSELFRDR
jgi:ribose-phosphate pyrophosphokinase